VKELLSFWPGEYQVFDLQTKQTVLNLGAAPVRANSSQ
jgi:hypothetical protein